MKSANSPVTLEWLRARLLDESRNPLTLRNGGIFPDLTDYITYPAPTNLVPIISEPDKLNLLTTIYVPYTYTTTPAPLIPFSVFRVGPPKSDGTDDEGNTVPFWSSNNGAPYNISDHNPANNDNKMDLTITMDYTLLADKNAVPSRTKKTIRYKTFRIIGVARLCGYYHRKLFGK